MWESNPQPVDFTITLCPLRYEWPQNSKSQVKKVKLYYFIFFLKITFLDRYIVVSFCISVTLINTKTTAILYL